MWRFNYMIFRHLLNGLYYAEASPLNLKNLINFRMDSFVFYILYGNYRLKIFYLYKKIIANLKS